MDNFRDEDRRWLNLLSNKERKPITEMLVVAVRHYAREVFGDRSIDEVLGKPQIVAEEQAEFGPKVQKKLFGNDTFPVTKPAISDTKN